jgi:hypothetical protein
LRDLENTPDEHTNQCSRAEENAKDYKDQPLGLCHFFFLLLVLRFESVPRWVLGILWPEENQELPTVEAVYISNALAPALSRPEQGKIIRDVIGNPFRPVTFSQSWRTDTAVSLARMMYDARDFSAMPILADALQDAGCDNEDILDHCRGPGPHVQGCWVVDLVLGKE